MKKVLIVLSAVIVMLFSNKAYTQNLDDGLNFEANIGFPTLAVSGLPTFAITGGFGIEKPMSENFSWEGQLKGAYFSFDRQDGIAQDGGYIGFLTLNVGGRSYWNSRTANLPIFTNLMIGGGLWLEEEYNANNVLSEKNGYTFSLGSGTYIAINNKIVTGLAVDFLIPNGEAEVMLSAKVGYQF